ncbi:MAG: acylneuraminate cytidylyltransferase family protein, partial [Desulfobacteraceae bacterium]|nr:acylneuraminate cytidylyltransferase family protein [Desulfobacteraceae bacterium]
MIGKRKVVAIIPARGGSKGLLGKNIIDLCGKPLIAYTIEAALKSKYIDRVIVTTDNKKIARISEECGAEVPFIRPKYLARDTTHTPPVIEHAVKFIERHGCNVDFVVTL